MSWNDRVFACPSTREIPSSWWARYAPQHSRVAFDRALARELPRLHRVPMKLHVNIITARDEGGLRAERRHRLHA